ncbi:MAG: malectin domain-containing carbohydrate-binding protein, partial [Bacteroidia bacterium]|nr:malectin domain-containing carbohydrate-binding protein [Bacteroidia bacterium]
MKTIISNIHRLFLLPLLLLMSQLASGQVAISIDPASPSVNVGDAFSVVIKVSTGAQQLDGVSTFLDFDPTLINVVSVTPSATTTSAFPNVLPSPFNPGTIYFDNTIGQIAYGAGTLSVGAALGDFDFVTLDLIAVGAGNAVISFLTSPINLQTTASLGGTNFASSLSGATISIAAVNSVPVISPIGNASVNENGTIQVPLSISDADGDNLTVTITSVSNEPQELQTANAGIQVDPYPTTASGFLAQNGISSSAGAYSASLDFSPTFGDGGSNGDGNAVYTITVQVSDEDGNSITETFDLTVNDVVQTISGSGVTRIEAESFDNQGPANTFPGNSSGDTKGIGVEIAPTFTNIGFTTKGDFVEYEIDVLSAGNYDCDFFISCPNNRNGATMNVSSDGNPLGTFTVATTNGYGNYASQGMVLALPAGTQTLRFDFDWTGLASNNLFNIDYFDLTLLPPNNSPTIAAISLQELAAGGLVTVGVSVSDDNNPAASIAIFDKSLGGTNNPFTPGTQVSPSNYTFSDNGGGSYTLTWQTALAEARSYEARVTANDGVNPPVTEVFDINVAHPVPGIFLANTISAPTPWYGNGPIAPFTVSIETAGNIGWVDNGEFIEYLIDVPSAGLYEIRLNSSNGSGVANNFFVFEEGNATALGSATVLSNGWGSFADYTIPIVLSNAGLQTLRIEFTGGTNTQEIELSVLPDLAPPVIILLGADPQDLSVGDSYTELGATASDNVDGDISANIVIDASAVNTTTPGSYPVTYNVSDAAGNAAITATRTVNVNAVAPFQLCIACGSIGLTAFGRTFEADNPVSNANQTGSHPTRTAGKKFAGYGGAIAGTSTPDELLLFQKEIFGGNTGSAGANPNFSYNIPVPNGTYAVDLYFSEVFHPSSGGRIFDVLLEGNVILDEYDLVDPIKDGISVNQTAITRTYFVNVTDGSLDVQIGPASLDNGKLSGLCVSAVSSANLMPVAAIGNLSTDALVAAAIPLGITDPEGDVLTVVLNGLPASLSYNSSSGQLEGTPLATDAGTYTINAIISDGTSSPITEEFSLVINPPAV